MSHVGERVVLMLCLQSGSKIGIFDSSTSTAIFFDIRKLRPTFLLSTPQGFSVPFQNAEQALRRFPMRFWIMRFAIKCKAKAYRRPTRCNRLVMWLLDRGIFSKFIAQTGPWSKPPIRDTSCCCRRRRERISAFLPNFCICHNLCSRTVITVTVITVRLQKL